MPKSHNKIKSILIAILFGLIIAGLWVFAGSSNRLTIIDPDPENPAKMIIDAGDEERKTIISPAPLDE